MRALQKVSRRSLQCTFSGLSTYVQKPIASSDVLQELHVGLLKICLIYLFHKHRQQKSLKALKITKAKERQREEEINNKV